MSTESKTSQCRDAPYFSIIVVTYNAENSIVATLKSLHGQTFQDFEIIIVDGCSSDGTLKAIVNSGVRVDQMLVEPDKGIYDAMNKGMELARGKFIAFLNAGDSYIEDGLELVNRFTSGTSIRLFSMDYEVVSPIYRNKKNRIFCRPLELKFLKRDFQACHQSIFVRHDLCVKYREDYDILADYQWAIDMSSNCESKCEIAHVDVPITQYEDGGYSAQNLMKNLKERILIHYYNFGGLRVLLNVPNYLRRVLRSIKERILEWIF